MKFFKAKKFKNKEEQHKYEVTVNGSKNKIQT